MYIAEIEIENFRTFGEGDQKFRMPFSPGLTAIVGENDSGKTTVIDAIRLVLGTSDQEYFRVDQTDFHVPPGEASHKQEFSIRCKLDGLSMLDKGAFAEYLTYEKKDDGTVHPVLYIKLVAKDRSKRRKGRWFSSVEVKSGANAEGPSLDAEARSLLATTYLRPLRDAEKEMSAGRGSRLSQILQHTEEVTAPGEEKYEPQINPNPDVKKLSVLDVGDFANDLLKSHKGIEKARMRLNTQYLKPLAFSGNEQEALISIGVQGEDSQRLRQLLEKLELHLSEGTSRSIQSRQGLGSNNLLFMACELLLLGAEDEGFPLLLIEEPEAHLHPQRQLRLMQFLQKQVEAERKDQQKIQIIITTHSPNLASVLSLDNMVLLREGTAFALAEGQTKLAKNDYRFLERFLDVTKANLFFARGVMVVEGDAENILIPTLAKLIGRDFTEHGVSIVNVGGVGLGRYSRIFQRNGEGAVENSIPVACVTDLDVMPDCAPEIVGKVKPGEDLPPIVGRNARKWRVKSDLGEAGIATKRANLCENDGQGVRTFPAEEWTLEYDLAFSTLAEDIYISARLANADDAITSEKKTKEEVIVLAQNDFAALPTDEKNPALRASHIYSLLVKGNASKVITAQYLAERLISKYKVPNSGDLETIGLCEKALPDYLVDAIKHVTPLSVDGPESRSGKGVGEVS